MSVVHPSAAVFDLTSFDQLLVAGDLESVTDCVLGDRNQLGCRSQVKGFEERPTRSRRGNQMDLGASHLPSTGGSGKRFGTLGINRVSGVRTTFQPGPDNTPRCDGQDGRD